jgi:membrane glycosyltransferase
MDRSIVRLQNEVNILNQKTEKLEKEDFYTYSDENDPDIYFGKEDFYTYPDK